MAISRKVGVGWVLATTQTVLYYQVIYILENIGSLSRSEAQTILSQSHVLDVMGVEQKHWSSRAKNTNTISFICRFRL